MPDFVAGRLEHRLHGAVSGREEAGGRRPRRGRLAGTGAPPSTCPPCPGRTASSIPSSTGPCARRADTIRSSWRRRASPAARGCSSCAARTTAAGAFSPSRRGWCGWRPDRAAGSSSTIVADIARLSGAAGVHVGQDDLPAADGAGDRRPRRDCRRLDPRRGPGRRRPGRRRLLRRGRADLRHRHQGHRLRRARARPGALCRPAGHADCRDWRHHRGACRGDGGGRRRRPWR